jgi:hypothetical protein
MKPTTNWAKEYSTEFVRLCEDADAKLGDGVVSYEDIHEIIIARIQLDAFKAGAEWAEHRCESIATVHSNPSIVEGCQQCQKAILSATSQLTELPNET